MSNGLSHSVQTRLLQQNKRTGGDPNVLFPRYATERLLYRLSRSPYADRFVLKGALMLLVWLGERIRSTRDADLLGFGDLDATTLRQIFTELCTMEVEPDGLTFDTSSIRITPIRPEDAYGGQRVTLLARLGPARLHVQVDIGIGDAVTPEPEWIEYPSLLDLPRPRIRAYRPETSIAEKINAMVVLGRRNSRIRDFFDVHALAARESFDGAVLSAAVRATFKRRDTPIPAEPPIAFTSEFAELEGKRLQWAGFVRRSHVTAPADFAAVVQGVGAFAWPVLDAVGRNEPFTAKWKPGGPWEAGVPS